MNEAKIARARTLALTNLTLLKIKTCERNPCSPTFLTRAILGRNRATMRTILLVFQGLSHCKYSSGILEQILCQVEHKQLAIEWQRGIVQVKTPNQRNIRGRPKKPGIESVHPCQNAETKSSHECPTSSRKIEDRKREYLFLIVVLVTGDLAWT